MAKLFDDFDGNFQVKLRIEVLPKTRDDVNHRWSDFGLRMHIFPLVSFLGDGRWSVWKARLVAHKHHTR